jgi:radical SAM superfamily enzyme YgiQ (UPF0313 family)
MTIRRSKVWLADLTYTQQTVSSDIMPAAVGCIATYTAKALSTNPEIRIFKFPEKLAEALNHDTPDVIGFSNYAWNENLAYQFATVMKRRRPRIITVFGGPNYPTSVAEQEEFLRRRPMIDFYVVKEGEIAFAKLVAALEQVAFDPARVADGLPSVHRLTPEGRFSASPTIERLTDLSEIPSPYLTGRMDEFFDGIMLPIIQTNRGCPFACTFCVEGMDYYTKVAKTKTVEKIQAELEYIAERMARLREENRGRNDLHIADSNFGMYKEDLEICAAIRTMQERYGFPEYINVATGKNHKERVLQAAAMINGALRLSGTVQSLDAQVLKNIKRANISTDALMELAREASGIRANSYSEIILGLPGDSPEAHFNSIRTIVEADFNTLCLYQLMLLPGTELATEESIGAWGMQTRYRLIPRCYGYFDALDEPINAAEIERICVANNSMTFAQYLECRRMHLVVNLFYNDGVFKEVLALIKRCGLSVYAWLERLYHYRDDARLGALFDRFLEETEHELWTDEEDLRRFVQDRENIKRFIAGELGANLIFKYRSLALVDHVADLARAATETLTELFTAERVDETALALGHELIRYAQLRMTDIFKPDVDAPRETFRFDVERFTDDATKAALQGPAAYRLDTPREITFVQTREQAETIRRYVNVYGDTVAGMSRILSKIYVRRLFRISSIVEAPVASRELHIRDAALTGLNEFA